MEEIYKTNKTYKLFVIALILMGFITFAHYSTGSHYHALHNVFRRLYYVPVVLAAFGLGLKGGLGVAVLSSIAYIPHAFFMHQHAQDPAPTLDKFFEIILYLLVGALTGWLVEREHKSYQALQRSLKEKDEMEEALVRAGKLSAMGELLAGVAHEIRNPLAAILGAAEGLARHLKPGAKQHRLVELQLREINRLDRVVSNFLVFAKTAPPTKKRHLVSSIIEETIELAKHHSSAGKFRIDDNLLEHKIMADRDQISQVLLNLTLNGIQAAKNGESPVLNYQWRPKTLAGTHYHCIGVTDSGQGLTAEEINKIFDPYYTTRTTGSGLGLSISSRLIEAHHGFIEVESEPMLETTFWICLPASDFKD